MESKGKAIGMSGNKLNIIMTGDSAYVGNLLSYPLSSEAVVYRGATIALCVVIMILEHYSTVSNPTSTYQKPSSVPPHPLSLPLALVTNYAMLDFNFTSWMTPANLKVLREETEADENKSYARTPTAIAPRSSSFFENSSTSSTRMPK